MHDMTAEALDRDDLAVIVIGLGYFSQFHLDAWSELPGVSLAGVCDRDPERLDTVRRRYSVPGAGDAKSLLEQTQPDIVDVIAPPNAHASLIVECLAEGRTVICQKPFCTSYEEAAKVVQKAKASGTRLVVHENFRFQPWHRAIKAFLEAGRLGEIYQAVFRLRPGDGRGPNAYLARQPSFQSMPRFLVNETGVHFIDLFRWLFGEIDTVYADLRQLNPALAGEDAGTVLFTHRSGTRSLLDGNRLSDHCATDLRRTMGEFCIEGENGALTLDGDSRLTFRAFGARDEQIVRAPSSDDEKSFGGGCVGALIAHVVEALRDGREPENLASDYLRNIQIVDATYEAAQERRRIEIT